MPRKAAHKKTNRINELRALKKWNQTELAEAVGAHWVTVSKLERGQMKLTQDWMEKLAKALDVRPSDLLADSPQARTVYIQGTINDKGEVGVPATADDEPVPFEMQIGVEEPNYSEWHILSHRMYEPYIHLGDFVRFTFFEDLEPQRWVGHICQVEAEGIENNLIGVLRKGVATEGYDVELPSRWLRKGVQIKRLGVLSMVLTLPNPMPGQFEGDFEF